MNKLPFARNLHLPGCPSQVLLPAADGIRWRAAEDNSFTGNAVEWQMLRMADAIPDIYIYFKHDYTNHV
jgi:hypothetical protein